jgi:hypothetical protein
MKHCGPLYRAQRPLCQHLVQSCDVALLLRLYRRERATFERGLQRVQLEVAPSLGLIRQSGDTERVLEPQQRIVERGRCKRLANALGPALVEYLTTEVGTGAGVLPARRERMRIASCLALFAQR